MEHINQTALIRFILLGLSDIPHLQLVYFLGFFVMYTITLSANILLIFVVMITPKLHTPMYFFLTNLSVIDISFSCTAVPKILMNTLSTDKSISFLECAVQMYVHMVLGAAESILLAVMAYDRFVAICRPLHYKSIMNIRFCIYLVAMSWSVGFINSFILVLPTLNLPFCGSNHVNHFFCEIPPFLLMSCADTRLNEIIIYISAAIIVMSAFFLTLISYVHIVMTILKIHSIKRRYRLFSTCASHLLVVTLYYGTIMFMYVRPHSTNYRTMDKIISLLYTTVTPMLNPFIYSMRNKDVIGSMNSLHKHVCFGH
ncbi:olfactory receptor 5V1-like [Bufo gargarizans]|uniref:olfactory receptor 5V1-like n=1 Tax=Bufo gargarizans TaxID=30331 RepID=UPI001CF2AA89|nr:olfactory receptor 5V1-like [Bufo gargarizans]